jgi:hypothetical protein
MRTAGFLAHPPGAIALVRPVSKSKRYVDADLDIVTKSYELIWGDKDLNDRTSDFPRLAVLDALRSDSLRKLLDTDKPYVSDERLLDDVVRQSFAKGNNCC